MTVIVKKRAISAVTETEIRPGYLRKEVIRRASQSVIDRLEARKPKDTKE